jgi:hypothetical protein
MIWLDVTVTQKQKQMLLLISLQQEQLWMKMCRTTVKAAQGQDHRYGVSSD